MIVIPMLGKSSRFFNAGYAVPKYQLPLGNETVFAKVLRSFEKYFECMPFLFLVRNDYDARAFVARTCAELGILDFRIKEFDFETKGQAESVYLGTKEYRSETPFVVFNIDTIRLGYEWPAPEEFAHGYLEVFKAEGNAWSFIEPDGADNNVKRTTEKDRISDLCSNGLYGFLSLADFREAYESYVSKGNLVNGELYIAPLYNHLIASGRNIKYKLIPSDTILHCGVPTDYESLKKILG